MKKFISIIFSSLLASSVVFAAPSSASVLDESKQSQKCINEKSADAKVLYKKKQTTNPETLYKMATNKESYLTEKELNKFSNNEVFITGDKKNKNNELEKINLDTIATSELVEIYEVDGVKTEVFAVTEFALVTEEDLVGTLASERDYGEKWDSSISVKAYSTNNYNRSFDNGENSCIDLTSVTGGWTISDSSVSVGTKTVNYGQTGRRCGSGSGVTQNSKPLYPGGLTYNYAVPSSYVGVTLTADSTVVGQRSQAVLTRGSSKWSLDLTNNVNS